MLGDYPEWLDPHLAATFGDERGEEGAALASRAPLDLRVNTLKADRDEAIAELSDLAPEPTRWSPTGLRIRLAADAKSPAVHAEAAFIKGFVEVQDEGSQLAALLAGAKAGRAGDRSLRRRRRQDAGACGGDGESRAALRDRSRQAPARADPRAPERAGARNVQVRTPQRRQGDVLADLAGRADLVLIDAPCTGSGAWRRNPDAKWRVRPGALADAHQGAGGDARSRGDLVKPGGRIAYVTCSVLAEENGDQVRDFLAPHPDFAVVPPAEVARRSASAPSCSPRRADVGGGDC